MQFLTPQRSRSALTWLFAGLVASASSVACAIPSFRLTAGPVPAGQTLVVSALASDVADLYGYQFTLHFDPTRVRFASVDEGSFLSRGGSTFFDGGTVDASAGTVSFVFDTLIGAVPGVSGDGELARFAFSTLQSGGAAFSLSDVLALDATLAPIDVPATPTLVAAVPEPATGSLLLLGALSVAYARRDRRRAWGRAAA